MKQVVVLGAGLVGNVIARDLNADFEVTVTDVDEARLEPLKQAGLQTAIVNILDDEQLAEAVRSADVVVGAVPGSIGFTMLEKLIRLGKNVSDISFFPEDSARLHQLALDHGVTCLTDIGVAPGIDNLILGHHASKSDVKRFECLVGGLPKHPQPPYNYKAPFSPADVIEEYVRPSRFRRDGQDIEMAALTEPEMITLPGAGELEAFLTDGLRSLLTSFPNIPDMVEKTLRYPGHRLLMEQMRDGGFFSEDLVMVNGQSVKPLDLTSGLLFDHWKQIPGEPEFTVMRVVVESAAKTWTYDLYDETDMVTGYSSMARTTGFTCAAGANLLLRGEFTEPGVFPPEKVGMRANCFEFVMNYLKDRNVTLDLSAS